MTAGKKSVCEQIQSLRDNLKCAEENFRADNGTRGELELMLAEAQIQFLREKRGGSGYLTRQSLSFLVAIVLVAVGAVGWFWAKSTAGESVASGESPQVVQKNALPAVQEASVAAAVVVPVQKDVPAVASATGGCEYAEETNVMLVAEKPVLVEEPAVAPEVDVQELRSLVRLARKTLHNSN